MDHTVQCASAIAYLEGRHGVPLSGTAHSITLTNLTRRLLAIEHRIEDMPAPSPFDGSTWNGMVWRLWRLQAKGPQAPISQERLGLMTDKLADEELRVTRLGGFLDSVSADLPELRCPKEDEQAAKAGEEEEECEACVGVIIQKLAYLGGTHAFLALSGDFSKKDVYAYASFLSFAIDKRRAEAKPPPWPAPSRATMDYSGWAGYSTSTEPPRSDPKSPDPAGPAHSPSERGRRRARVETASNADFSPLVNGSPVRADNDSGCGFDKVCQRPGCSHESLFRERSHLRFFRHNVVDRQGLRIYRTPQQEREIEGFYNKHSAPEDILNQNVPREAAFNQNDTQKSNLGQDATEGAGYDGAAFNQSGPRGDACNRNVPREATLNQKDTRQSTFRQNTTQGAGCLGTAFNQNINQGNAFSENVPQGDAVNQDFSQGAGCQRCIFNDNVAQDAALNQNNAQGAAFNQSTPHAAAFDYDFPEGDTFSQDVPQASAFEFDVAEGDTNRQLSEALAYILNVARQADFDPSGNKSSENKTSGNDSLGNDSSASEPSDTPEVRKAPLRRRPVAANGGDHGPVPRPSSVPKPLPVPKTLPVSKSSSVPSLSPVPRGSPGPKAKNSAWAKKMKFWRSKELKARTGV